MNRIFMDEKPEKSGWNWGAFLFGVLWYLYKGMLEKGILLFVLGLFSFLFFGLAGTVVVALYCGIRGTEDYYIHWKQRRRLLKQNMRAKKKSGWEKWKGTIILCLLLVAIFLFPSSNGSQQANNAPQEVLSSMSQGINVDYLIYNITNAETFTEMGTSMFNKKTNGKFVKVYIAITNNANETKYIFTPRVNIIDNQSRQYDQLSDYMMYIADYFEFGKQLQPGLKARGAIVFELPEDSAGLILMISGDWLSASKVKVSLSNVNDIGKDTTQQAKQDKLWNEMQ